MLFYHSKTRYAKNMVSVRGGGADKKKKKKKRKKKKKKKNVQTKHRLKLPKAIGDKAFTSNEHLLLFLLQGR